MNHTIALALALAAPSWLNGVTAELSFPPGYSFVGTQGVPFSVVSTDVIGLLLIEGEPQLLNCEPIDPSKPYECQASVNEIVEIIPSVSPFRTQAYVGHFYDITFGTLNFDDDVGYDEFCANRSTLRTRPSCDGMNLPSGNYTLKLTVRDSVQAFSNAIVLPYSLVVSGSGSGGEVSTPEPGTVGSIAFLLPIAFWLAMRPPRGSTS